MQTPGYEHTDHGTAFDDYENAIEQSVRGDEMNGAAQEAYTQSRLRN